MILIVILIVNTWEFWYIIKIFWLYFCNVLHIGSSHMIKFISKYFCSFCHILKCIFLLICIFGNIYKLELFSFYFHLTKSSELYRVFQIEYLGLFRYKIISPANKDHFISYNVYINYHYIIWILKKMLNNDYDRHACLVLNFHGFVFSILF